MYKKKNDSTIATTLNATAAQFKNTVEKITCGKNTCGTSAADVSAQWTGF
jgi:hypothetical protein